MTTLSEVSGWIAEHLPAVLDQFGVPGAAVGILGDDGAGRAAYLHTGRVLVRAGG